MNFVAALRVFARIVERGSMTAAARDLGVSQPAVSKIIRDLEAHTGARLLQRSSRVMRPTAQGQTLYAATGGALSTIDAAVESLRSGADTICGDLHVLGPVCIGEHHLTRIVLDFRSDHPGVKISLTLEDRVIDLIESGIDLAVRVGQPDLQNVVARRIGASRRFLVASPDYLARHGAPKSRREIASRDLIVAKTSLSRRGTFRLCRGKTTTEVAVQPMLTTNNPRVLVEAAIAGRGIAVTQHLLVADELDAGRLIRVLPNYEIEPTELFLTYPSSKFLRPVVRAFIDKLIPAIRRIDGIV